ncbi:13280_t:CDS:2, partial [Funneliformis mosseae]
PLINQLPWGISHIAMDKWYVYYCKSIMISKRIFTGIALELVKWICQCEYINPFRDSARYERKLGNYEKKLGYTDLKLPNSITRAKIYRAFDDRETSSKMMARLNSIWQNNMVFRETKYTPYLNGYKPDLSIFDIDDISNDAFNTIAVQNLKKHKRTIGFSDEEKGQLVDYLHILMEQQPSRRLFFVFLSDMTYFYVTAFDRNTSQYQEYQTDFKTGLRLFSTSIYRNSGVKICGPTSVDFVNPVSSSRTNYQNTL